MEMTREEKIKGVIENNLDYKKILTVPNFFEGIQKKDVIQHALKDTSVIKGYFSEPGTEDGTYIVCSTDGTCIYYTQERRTIHCDINLHDKKGACMKYLDEVCRALGIKD